MTLVKAFIHRFSKWHLATVCSIYELLWLNRKPENSPGAKPEFLRIKLKQNPRKAADFKEAMITVFALQEFYISDKFWGSLLPYGDSLSRKLLPHSHVSWLLRSAR